MAPLLRAFRTIASPSFKVQTFPRRLRTSVHHSNSSLPLNSYHPPSRRPRRAPQTNKHTPYITHISNPNHAELRFHCSCSCPAPGYGRPRYAHKPVAHVDLLNLFIYQQPRGHTTSVSNTSTCIPLCRRSRMTAVALSSYPTSHVPALILAISSPSLMTTTS